MSHTTSDGRSSPASLKRKRESTESSHPRVAPETSFKAPKLMNGASAVATDTPHTNGFSSAQHHEGGDMLQGVGSASSLASTTSSVFSNNKLAATSRAASNGFSPLTSMTESSSPRPSGASDTHQKPDTTTIPPSSTTDIDARPRPSLLPPAGTAKGYRVVYDPELDGKLSKEERKRATVKRKDFGLETYEPDPPPDPRLAIPGYMSGNCRSNRQPSKAIWRLAPYNVQPYKIDKNSVGPGEAQQVVVVGFDPFLSESQLKLNFAQFGSIASVQSKTDPSTGSFLGIALVRFRDSASREDGQLPATVAAKRAEQQFNGQRIGLHTVKVEADREGRKCKRYMDVALKKAREERDRESRVPPPPPPPIPTGPRGVAPPTGPSAAAAPPINAPRGPSGARPAVKIPEGPRALAPPTPSVAPGTPLPTAPRNTSHPQIEDELVLPKLKRKPYIFIANDIVPVLVTTIPHLKKRLKAFDWREVRVDRTGYYVVFDNSKRGEDETQRCYNECNKAALFTYAMEMQCQKYGNPDYERSPSPERAKVIKMQKEEYDRMLREELEDLEIEKKNRADNLDPVLGAIEQLKLELRDKIMSDIKMRIAIPIFHESLEPGKHTALRRKLGLPDPLDIENKAPTLLFNKADTPPQTPRGRFGHSLSRPLRPHDPNQRGRRPDREQDKEPVNAYLDERRRRPAPRAAQARGLHFRLQQMFDEDDDSDEERRTSLTRDTEDQESRPLSRASRTSTPFESEVGETPKKRKRLVDTEHEDKENFTELQRSLVGHLLHKEPEDLATRELELVIHTLPRSSKFAGRARTELFMRQRAKADDDLFQVSRDAADLAVKDAGFMDVDGEPVKQKLKKKRKTKKEIEEEKAALKAVVKSSKVKHTQAVHDDEDEEETAAVKPMAPEEVDLTVSYDKPHRTVEDPDQLIMDVDGWQHAIKDDEDMAFLRSALAEEDAMDIGDARLWAWKQKNIKTLNNGGVDGPVTEATGIVGYYVPNSTGSARTEGVKKILNEEKSKYLPHRIKVQKAREERQALAKTNPAAAAEAAKTAAAERILSTATSRSNRANNRRLVNDINLQKQAIATANSDADVAIRFNQLKKRKKLVKFDRSAIHGWGLYAEENIAVTDLIIEYVGEKVRQKVADMREIRYDKQGVGSSYLFRMIDDEIVDATKRGGIARFINHSCDPNCTAKIIKVEGTPRIVIYALKDILKNQELTYDYKFEREFESNDRIPCLCGSANCKGFLN